MSDGFYRPRQPTFHGRISTDRRDRGFDNYHTLRAAHYRLHIFLDGKEYNAVTADPEAGTIEFYQGYRMVILKGHVEIKLERDKPSC